MSFIAMGVAGVALGVGGAYLSGKEADKKIKGLEAARGMWMPNVAQDQADYFGDMKKYMGDAQSLSRSAATADQDTLMALREKALPGIGQAQRDELAAITPLLKGQLPPEVLNAFMRSGGASSVGAGMGGSGFGFLNQGLFGARGSLGAMSVGSGLLGALIGQTPMANSPGTASFLQAGVETPGQRTSTQMGVRSQNLGISQTIAGMPTSGDKWGEFMSSTGGMLAGAGMTGMGGGGGFGGGGGGSMPMGGGGFGGGMPVAGGWQGMQGGSQVTRSPWMGPDYYGTYGGY